MGGDKPRQSILYLAGLSLLALLLAACGGGDGNGGSATATPGAVDEESPTTEPAFTTPLDIPARPEQNVLYIVGEDGTGLRELVTRDSLWNVQWSPEGDEVTFITSESGELRLSIMTASGGKPRVIRRVEDPTSSIDYLWSPQGDIAFLVEGDGELIGEDGSSTGTFGAERLIAWSPDGSGLLVQESEAQRVTLSVIDATTAEERSVASAAGAWPTIARWSPEGDRISYVAVADGGPCEGGGVPLALEVTDLGSGERERAFGPVCAELSSHAWSPDSSRMAFAVPSGLGELERGVYVLQLETGSLRQVTSGEVDFDVAWLTDGEHLVVKRASCWQCGGTQWWALVSADEGQIAEWPGRVPGLGAAARSARVAVGAATGELLVADPAAQTTRTLFEAAPFQFRDVAWSPDDERIAFVRWAGLKDTAYTVSLSTDRVEPIVLPPEAYGTAFSPALDRVAYIKDGALVVAPAGRPDEGTRVADDARLLGASPLSWSPDGERIAFLRVTDFPQGELVVADADGLGLNVLRDVDVGGVTFTFSWTPDSGTLLIAAATGDTPGLRLIDLTTGEETLLLTGRAGPLSWSPDGARLAAILDNELVVVNADGGDPRRVLAVPPNMWTGIAWSPDGETIAVLAVAAHGLLWLVNADGSNPREVASALPAPRRFPGEYAPDLRGYISHPTLSWSPNGRTIAFNFLRNDGHGVFLYDLADGTLRPLSLTARPGYRHIIAGWSPDGERLGFVSEWCPGSCR